MRGTYSDFRRTGSSSHHLLPALLILQVSRPLRLVLTVTCNHGAERKALADTKSSCTPTDPRQNFLFMQHRALRNGEAFSRHRLLPELQPVGGARSNGRARPDRALSRGSSRGPNNTGQSRGRPQSEDAAMTGAGRTQRAPFTVTLLCRTPKLFSRDNAINASIHFDAHGFAKTSIPRARLNAGSDWRSPGVRWTSSP